MGVHFGGQLTVTYRTVTTNNDEFLRTLKHTGINEKHLDY